jgi:hypothetical protein
MAVGTTGTANQYGVVVDDTNVAVFATDRDGGSVFSTTFASNAAMFGVWTQWSFNIEQSGGNVNWSVNVVTIPGLAVFSTSGNFAGTVGRVGSGHNWLTNAPADGGISFGHLIVSTGVAYNWLTGPETAWAGETAAHRFWRLCIEEDIPVHVIGDDSVYESARGDPSLSTPMGSQGQRALPELLAECALVDGGIMSEHRSAPALDYRTRATLYNQATAVTLDADLRGIGREFTPVDDDQRLVNDITVTRTGGSSVQLTTDPPPDPLEVYETEVTLNVHDGTQLPDQAGWRLHMGTWPAMRYPGLGTSLRTAGPTVAGAWADTALGDRVTLDNLPRQHEQTTDIILEGYTETLSYFDWHTGVNASPEGPWEVGIREDADMGIRDTSGSELNSSFAAGTATTMSVVTTLGPLWAVTAATNSALPFDVNVGGFRITVTAIGAAAGQVQTFTVVAAPVNLPGVTKTIAVGTPVSLWCPARRAL